MEAAITYCEGTLKKISPRESIRLKPVLRARQVRVVRREQVDRGRYQKSTNERRRASEWSRQKRRRQIIKALCSKRLGICVYAWPRVSCVSGRVHNSVTHIDDGSTTIF